MSDHDVKTEAGADKWADGKYTDLPITIQQYKCNAKRCGRSGYKVYQDDELIHRARM